MEAVKFEFNGVPEWSDSLDQYFFTGMDSYFHDTPHDIALTDDFDNFSLLSGFEVAKFFEVFG